MKLFVSGKIGDEALTREIMEGLKNGGHEITLDWTRIGHLKPYDENPSASAKAAVLEVQGVKEADALVLVAHDRGIGMYVELGVALGTGKPVYLLSSRPSRTMFFHHPLVARVTSLSELVEKLASVR